MAEFMNATTPIDFWQWVRSEADPRVESPADSDAEDRAWIDAIHRRDDGDAFEALVRKYERRICALAHRFTTSDADEEDLAQEIFLQVHRQLSRFRGDSPFEHWLMRVATNCCRMWLRRTSRRPRCQAGEAAVRVLDSLETTQPDRSELREMIDAALAVLKPDDRLVITLFELEEKSVAEIVQLTGWSAAKVKTRACRARRQLAKLLEGEWP